MSDSWQARIFLRLRDRGWYRIGDLFESIEVEIPLHLAMRNAMNTARGLCELPDGTTARWRKFLSVLSAIGVETSGDRYNFKWGDAVRLRHVEGRVCEDCGGPVIKASWATGRIGDRPPRTACLACEAATVIEEAEPIVEKAALPRDFCFVMPKPQTGNDRIDDAVAYAFLHRLIEQWGPPTQYQKSTPWKQGARAPPQVTTLVWTPDPIRRKPNERTPNRSQTG